MAWTDIADAMHRAILGSGVAELVTLTSADDVSSVQVSAVYDRPPVIDETGGVDFRGADHRVAIQASDLPAWCDRGAKVTVRGLELIVEDAIPGGQGMIELDCNRGG